MVRPRDVTVPLGWTFLLILGDAALVTALRTAPTLVIDRRAFASDFRAAALDAVGRMYEGLKYNLFFLLNYLYLRANHA